MLNDALKIQLIEEVIKLEDKNILKEIENIIKKRKSKRTPSPKEKFIRELQASVREVSLAKQNKTKLQSAKEFLNDL